MKKSLRIYPGLAILLLIGVFLLPAGSAAAGQRAEWEITTTMEIPGMPFAMPPNTFRHCLEENGVPYQAGDGEECETISREVSGDTVSWRISCRGEDGRIEMTGVTTYTGDNMDSQVKMQSEDGEMSMHMTGRRLGSCN
ncbi:MAG: DUF3617 domain-containing protein [Desulfurivibrionaceae bacterium]